MTAVTRSPENPNYAVWTDEDGEKWEFRYIVTQFEYEGPEYLEYRAFGDPLSQWLRTDDPNVLEKHRVPDNVEDQLITFFCG